MEEQGAGKEDEDDEEEEEGEGLAASNNGNADRETIEARQWRFFMCVHAERRGGSRHR